MRFFRVVAAALVVAAACEKVDFRPEEGETLITLQTGGCETRSDSPGSEDAITDINLFVYNSAGKLEDKKYIESKDIINIDGQSCARIKLIKGAKYSIYVMANFGYQPQVKEFDDLMAYDYWLLRPDDYRNGLPMSGFAKDVVLNDAEVPIRMTRLMSKVNLTLDTSELDKDVSFHVTSVKVGNCPKRINVFGKGSVDNEDDVFPMGFNRKSLPASLYLLENLNPRTKNEASYVEIEADYFSSEYYTANGSLRYRFHIGEGENLGVERNCIYNITIVPKGDGLGGVDVSDWRIDKSELIPIYKGAAYIKQYPSDYIECHVGEKIHIGCEVYPPDTPFDVGEQYLEADQETGIYDYEIDEDGKGAWLTMKKGGMGWVYMEAGEPIDDAALFVIMCEP